MDDNAFGKIIHERLLSGDPVAPDDLCERWLEPLVRDLERGFGAIVWRDSTLIWDAVIKSLLDYAERPTIYQPHRSSLRSFLFFAARGDLLNLLESERRRCSREQPLALVEELSEPRNVSPEGQQRAPSVEDAALANLEKSESAQLVAPHFPVERDRQLVALILQGERKTGPYARVLDIDHLDRVTQQREVKRHKDRIGKRLRRLGEKIRDQRET